MYPFSFIIILFWIFNIVKNKFKKAFLNQLTFTIFISVFIEVGYFFHSDVINIEFWHISSILTFITAIPLLSNRFLIKKHFFYYVLTLLIGLFLLIIFPVHKSVVLGATGVNEELMGGISSYIEPHFSKFTIFFFSFSLIQAISIQVAFKRFNINDYYYLIHKISAGAKIIMVIVMAEIILRYWFAGVYENILIEVFGQGPSTMSENYLRGSSFMLQGLNREGSTLVNSLFIALIVIFVESKIFSNNKQNKFFIILGVVEISISMAFTSILVLGMLLLMYFIYRYYQVIKTRNIFRNIGIISLIIFVSLLILPLFNFADAYYYIRFLSSFNDISDLAGSSKTSILNGLTTLSSTTARIFSIIDNLSLLSYRPFFGVGIGTNVCHGSTALTLAETGILGLISYVYFYFFSMPINNKKIIYYILIFIWIAGNLFIAGPILMVRIDTFLFFVCLYLLLNNFNILNLKKKTC